VPDADDLKTLGPIVGILLLFTGGLLRYIVAQRAKADKLTAKRIDTYKAVIDELKAEKAIVDAGNKDLYDRLVTHEDCKKPS
jgi:hypothetical protein